MPAWTTALAVAAAAFLGAFAAALAPRHLPAARSRSWPAVTAVAAGLLLASALVIVIPEGFEMVFQHPGPADPFLALAPAVASGLAILAGFLLMLALESYGIAHEPCGQEDSGGLLFLGLGFHALSDGLALGAGIATGMMAVTLPILAAVMVHKIPVAFGLGTFLWRASRNPLGRLLLFSIATPLGLFLTFVFLRHLSHQWIGLLLLFSGGTFLYVATIDVLPRVRRHHGGHALFWRVGLGAALVVAVLVLVHSYGDPHDGLTRAGAATEEEARPWP